MFKSINFDTSDAHDKYLLYSQFVTWYCKETSIVPLSDYAHNPVYQELAKLNDYFKNADEKTFTDLIHGKGYTNEIEKINRDDSDLFITITLKAASMKKMRLRVTGYYHDKYLYPLSCEGLIMIFIEYGVNKPKCVAVNRRMKKKIT